MIETPREIALAHELASVLAAAATEEEVAHAVLHQGLPLFGADAGVMGLRRAGLERIWGVRSRSDRRRPLDRGSDHVELVAQVGYDERLVEAWRFVPRDLPSPLWDAVRLGEPVWVESREEALARYPGWAPALGEHADHAWAALPLIARGRDGEQRVLGALGLGYHLDRRFEERDRARLSSVAARCAQALDRAQDHDRLRVALDQLEVAKRAADLGLHEYDVLSGEIEWDARARELWGVEPSERITYDVFMSAIHPEDRERTQAAIDRALDPAGDGRYRAEYRIRSRKDGRERRVIATGQAFFAKGGAIRLTGTIEDVTEERRVQQALRESEQRLRIAQRAGQIGTFDMDLAARTVIASEITHVLFGLDPRRASEAIPVASFMARIHPEDVPAIEEAIRASVEDGQEHVIEYRVERSDGSSTWLHSRAEVVRDREGEPGRLVGALVDVTARREHEEVMRSAERRKDAFLATLSHELRNPLAAIRSGVALLPRVPPGSPSSMQALKVIERQSEQLARLVDDLLDLSRIAHDRIELRRERLDARELVQHACDGAEDAFASRGVALGIVLPTEPAWVEGDRTRLLQIVGNPLSNALKFTDPGGRVEASVVARGKRVELRVRDSGAGIAPEDLERIFDPFEQGSTKGAHGGLGIGLALVRRLARLHGGDVSARSEGQGRGAELVVQLPPAPPESSTSRS